MTSDTVRQGGIAASETQRSRRGNGSLTGRTVLVAGGSGNVGRYLVSGLLQEGARVVVPSRSAEKLERVRQNHGDAPDGRLLLAHGDVTDPDEGPDLLNSVLGQMRLDGAIASLGRFVAAPSVLKASMRDMAVAIDGYLMAHFGAARTIIPFLDPRGGSYTMINGPLAFELWSQQSSLISIATAGQAMLARALMREAEGFDDGRELRINELVIYTAVGWGDADKKSPIKPEDVGNFAAYLASERGSRHRGETIHLKSPEQLTAIE